MENNKKQIVIEIIGTEGEEPDVNSVELDSGDKLNYDVITYEEVIKRIKEALPKDGYGYTVIKAENES